MVSVYKLSLYIFTLYIATLRLCDINYTVKYLLAIFEYGVYTSIHVVSRELWLKSYIN